MCECGEGLGPITQNHFNYNYFEISTSITMRDFQTWLSTQVTAARGAACQVSSELHVCPGCSVYTSQAAEQVIKATLNIQNKLYLLALVFIGVMTLSWRHAFPKDRENAKLGAGK